MAELGLIYPHHDEMPRLLHNRSGKFESAFLVSGSLENRSVMLGNLSGMELGIWVAHGEGQFKLPVHGNQVQYHHEILRAYLSGKSMVRIMMQRVYALDDGRHLVMMLILRGHSSMAVRILSF